ncbi:MAG: amidohydrolase family protein, partial [Verrucomicrobiota bacterium]
PEIQSSVPDEKWQKDIRSLAERENVFCKLSGVVTEIVPSITEWDESLIRPYYEVVLDAFGADRLMFGSDWPVCLLRSSYQKWFETVKTWTAELSETEQANFWEKNARHAYNLEA